MAEVFLSREGVSWLKLLEWESVWHSCTMKKYSLDTRNLQGQSNMFKTNCCVFFHISFWNKLPLSKAPLPGPRSSGINSDDESLTDLQLFRKYCMPLRDTWPEAWSETAICLKHVRSLKQLFWTKLNLARCENISIYSTNFNDRSRVYIYCFFDPSYGLAGRVARSCTIPWTLQAYESAGGMGDSAAKLKKMLLGFRSFYSRNIPLLNWIWWIHKKYFNQTMIDIKVCSMKVYVL